MRQNRIFKLLTNLCRIILAATFIFSGFTKVIDPWGTALKVNEYLSIYGMEWLQPAAMTFSIWLCGAELMMGCMLLCKVRIRLISIFAVASMCFFTVPYLPQCHGHSRRGLRLLRRCAEAHAVGDLLKNLVLLPMAFVVWWRYRPDKIFAFKPLEIVLTCTFFFCSMYLGYYCYIHLPLIDFLPYKVGVNIAEAMHAPVESPAKSPRRCSSTAISARARREFSLDDTEWQNADEWEWVDTRTTGRRPPATPLIGEFALRDAREMPRTRCSRRRVVSTCSALPRSKRFRRAAHSVWRGLWNGRPCGVKRSSA